LEVAFVDETTAIAEWRFEADRPTTCIPVFTGRALPDEGLHLLPFFHGTPQGARTLTVKAAGRSVETTLTPRIGEAHLPWTGVKILCDDPRLVARLHDGTPDGQPSADSNLYAFEPSSPISISPDEPLVLRFQVEVRMAAVDQRPPPFRDAIEERPLEELREIRRSWVLGALGESDDPHVTRARLALVRNGLRGLNGEFGDDVASLCTSSADDFSCSFFWDTLFSSTAIARFNPEYARGAIATAFARHLERDGSTPERRWNFCVPERMFQQAPQSPVASWALCSYLERQDDPDFLHRMYPFLVRNHGFWEEHSDLDRDGLSEYRWTGQAADNSPLWDPYMMARDAVTGCSWLPPVASVPLNAFLFWDARHLEHLAKKVGNAEDAARFQARQGAIQSALDRVCYLPEERRYWDYNHLTQTHQRARTFYMFWPLVAGMDVPEATKRDLIENVLLDPEQFFGAVPFPSVPYDDPRHEPSGYWRGKAWPHISYWLLQMLWREGYQKEADIAADRMISVFTGTPGFLENTVASLKIQGEGGFADYNWGCASAALIMERAYREPMPLTGGGPLHHG
jgi:glycogen debranching enzyme